MKTTNNQTKLASDKIYTQEINRHFLEQNMDFSLMRLGKKSTRNEQKRQSSLKHCFFLKKKN